jgi:hypothetical protein
MIAKAADHFGTSPLTMKIAGAIVGLMLTGFVSWLTFVTVQLYQLRENDVRQATKMEAMSDKFTQGRDEELRRYEELYNQIQKLGDRLETKIDRLGSIGSMPEKFGKNP